MIDRRQLLLGAGALVVPAVTGIAPVGLLTRRALALRAETEGFVHPEWLVDSAWLAGLLSEPAVKVIAMQPAEDYERAHIPGAARVENAWIGITETSEPSIESWRASIGALLTSLGIVPGDTVVVYDAGSLHATRLWWCLDQVGHTDKRILNGGLPAWTESGGAVESGEPVARPAGTPYPVVPNEATVASLDEVIAAFDAANTTFVDARDAESYANGHIPGALSVPVEANAAADVPKYWKEVAELTSLYAGIPKDARVVPYCGGGVRAAGTYFSLRQLGYNNVALFTGSWNEWSAHPELPVATGDKP